MDEAKYLELVAETEVEFPEFAIKLKSDSRLMKACDLGLKLITFWRMQTFMRDFFTTIGYTLYVPEAAWAEMDPPGKACLLRHERIHMRQRKKYGFLFYLMFLFLPVPTIWAYSRMKFEREAYTESIRAWYEYYGLSYVQHSKVRAATISHFTTAEYFWMWPWRAGLTRWYDETADRLQGG